MFEPSILGCEAQDAMLPSQGGAMLRGLLELARSTAEAEGAMLIVPHRSADVREQLGLDEEGALPSFAEGSFPFLAVSRARFANPIHAAEAGFARFVSLPFRGDDDAPRGQLVILGRRGRAPDQNTRDLLRHLADIAQAVVAVAEAGENPISKPQRVAA